MKKLRALMSGKGLGYMVAAVLTIVFVGLRLADPVALQILRLKAFDLYQRIEPRQRAADIPVAIIDLDEESLAAYGQWPWPRTLLSELVAKLTQQGVAVIGFDAVFAEPDRTSPDRVAEHIPGLDPAMREALAALPNNDATFAAAIKASRVVLGQSTTSRATDIYDGRKAIQTSVGAVGVPGANPADFAFAFLGLVRNLPELEAAASGIGVFTLKPEVDGLVRRVPLVARVGTQLYPALTLEMLRVGLGRRQAVVSGDAAGITGVRMTKTMTIPTDEHGRAWVNYSRHDRSRYISAKTVLDGDVPPGRLRGHFVIIGTSAVGLLDIKATPVDDAMPGVEVQAQLLETMLEDLTRQSLQTAIDKQNALAEDKRNPATIEALSAKLAERVALGPAYLIRPNIVDLVEIAVLIVMCVLIAVVMQMVGAVWSLFVGVALSAGTFAISWFVYVEHGMLLGAAYITIVGFILYSLLTYMNYVREAAARRRVRGQFERYMSPALVEQLARNPERLHLGGEMRDMTLLFADIRGFTGISEQYKSDPQGLTRLINRFLTPMTDLILERTGTIDKYMGDCIMAFWNAPLDDKEHARNACGSALQMMIGVTALNVDLRAEAEAEERPFIPIKIGIGLNSGECCVGNMGSSKRFDYSVLGDDVNLASRLEGQSKTYGVDIVIGEHTRDRADDYAVIELDLIQVKGKKEAVRIFALLGEPEVCADPGFQALSERHKAMLDAYRGQRWSDAGDLIADCRKIDGKLDGLYDLYDERIADYIANPPGAEWDGVFVATSK